MNSRYIARDISLSRDKQSAEESQLSDFNSLENMAKLG